MKYLFTLLVLLCIACTLYAQPGTLDKTYANGGSFISGNYSVNTANPSSGSYLLKIQHGSTTVTLPFVKE